LTTTSKPEAIYQASGKLSGINACLPASILHLAAQFASTDAAKLLLNCVYVTKSSKGIEIQSTDGHRLFRFVIPSNFKPANDFYKVNSSEGLKIDARLLKKQVRLAKDVIINLDKSLDFIGGKGNSNELLERKFQSIDFKGTYPDIVSLIPDSFTNNPGKPIAFNPKYIGEFCKSVEKCSKGPIKMAFNTCSTPVVFTATCNVKRLENLELEYLLMPVLIR